MDRSQDQNRIVEYLRIKPISHSQIYTSQIAVPETQGGEIPRERREALRRSLIEQGSNLIPLIVRHLKLTATKKNTKLSAERIGVLLPKNSALSKCGLGFLK